jgi:hypothetical protein
MAQTELVKLSKQTVFVKLKNLSDKKIRLFIYLHFAVIKHELLPYNYDKYSENSPLYFFFYIGKYLVLTFICLKLTTMKVYRYHVDYL